MAIFGWSCGASGQSTYKSDMIRKTEVSSNMLKIAVPSETAYFMAGANIVQQKDDTVVLKLVRCRINKDCKVDIPASYNAETGFHELPVTKKNVTLMLGKGEKLSVSVASE